MHVLTSTTSIIMEFRHKENQQFGACLLCKYITSSKHSDLATESAARDMNKQNGDAIVGDEAEKVHVTLKLHTFFTSQ